MRCPVCKADHLTDPRCRRCKADLSLLFALEEQRSRTIAEARRCLRRREFGRAARLAETADWLRGDEESRQFAALAHLLRGDFAAAWKHYLRCRYARLGARGVVDGGGSHEK